MHGMTIERDGRKWALVMEDGTRYTGYATRKQVQSSIDWHVRDRAIRSVQDYCADIEEHRGGNWTAEDGAVVAGLLNQSGDGFELFRHMDERTGGMDVGYKTRDGREWFHILRQMRNTVGSGLLENLSR